MKSPIKKEMLSVRIPKPLNKEFTAYANRCGISKTAIILILIKRELEQQEKDMARFDSIVSES